MRSTKTNEKEHKLIAQQTADILASGGKIKEVPSNVYNRDTQYQQKNKSAFGEAEKCTSTK